MGENIKKEKEVIKKQMMMKKGKERNLSLLSDRKDKNCE